MLIDFQVENFGSINQAVSLNMIAEREQRFRERLAHVASYRKYINPIAAVFGANASGKSTLIKALNALKQFVLTPPSVGKEIPYNPFRFTDVLTRPTRFELVFLSEETFYEYVVSFTDSKVLEEKLSRYSARSEKVIFDRAEQLLHFGDSTNEVFSSLLLGTVPDNTPVVSHFESLNHEVLRELLRKTGDGNPNRSLSVLEEIRAPYQWLKKLFIVDQNFLSSGNPLATNFDAWEDAIVQIDAGIAKVAKEPIDFETLTEGIKGNKLSEELLSDIRKYKTIQLVTSEARYELASSEDASAKIQARRVSLVHGCSNGISRELPWSLESDGTKNAVEILNLVALAAQNDMVIAIDEFDRSFHTELSRAIIDGYLNTVNKASRSQLIFTTHDLLLMDPNRLRRDEMWITEKDKDGETSLTVLSEFKGIRKDSDIRRSYLQGRFGGVPDIMPVKFPKGEPESRSL